MPAEPLAEAVVKITADKSQMSSAVESVKKDVQSIDGPLDRLKSKLKEIGQQGGKSSGLGQLGKVLAGGGALIAVSMIGKELDHATAKVLELQSQFRKGEVDAAGMAVGIGESLPILGGFVSAGQNIREMFTHEKAAIEETNASIALGNKLMQLRKEASEEAEKAARNYAETTKEFNNKSALLNTLGSKAKERVQVEIEYTSDQSRLKETTRQNIDTIKKELESKKKEINDKFDAGDKSDTAKSDRTDQLAAAAQEAAKNIKKVQDEADHARSAMDLWHQAAVEDATGIRKEMDELQLSTAKTLAVTNTEKIANYTDELGRMGYTAEQTATLVDLFRDSLKAGQYAEYKQSLQDLTKQYNSLGETARETAMKTAAGLGATPDDIKQYIYVWDQLEQKLKTAKIGDLIKDMGEQVETFATTPLEALKKKLDFNFATPGQREEAIRLQVVIEGQEKAQKLADILKDINEQYKDANKSDIQKQIDQMTRLAEEAGEASKMMDALNAARQKLEQMKVDEFIKQQNLQRGQIGMSEPDKAASDLKASGVTDKKLLADAWMAAAKKAGAELQHSLETPFEQYQDKISDLQRLFNNGAIDKDTFNRAKANAGKEYQSAMGGPKSIEQSFKDNLLKQFNDFGLGKQKKDAQDAAARADKAEAAQKKHVKAVDDNTVAINNLNDILGKGVVGTYA